VCLLFFFFFFFVWFFFFFFFFFGGGGGGGGVEGRLFVLNANRAYSPIRTKMEAEKKKGP